METSNMVCVPLVKELLNEENYKDWSVRIKNYLLGHDLWHVIEDLAEPSNLEDRKKVWRRKNAAALHAIQMSCGPKAFSDIKDITLAKRAWDALKDKSSASSPPMKEEKEKAYDKKYKSLYKAVRDGDLLEVFRFLDTHPEGVNAIISEIGETALHIAVTFEHLRIVEELVKVMQEGDLERKNQFGYTALATAASIGITEMAECMIKKNRRLAMIPTDGNELPVTLAFSSNKKEMARYLYSETPLEELKREKGEHGANLLRQCFLSEASEFAVHLLERCPRLAIRLNYRNSTLLCSLATKPSRFLSGCQLQFWESRIYNWIQIELATATKDIRINIERSNARKSDNKTSKVRKKYDGLLHRLVNLPGIKRIYKLKLTHVLSLELLRIACNEIATLDDLSQLSNAHESESLFQAAEFGIPEFIIELLNVNPDLRYCVNEEGRSFFFHAVQYRQAKVFSLIYGVNSATRDDLANVKDNSDNTPLHMAALLAPSTQLNSIPGAALQMQRELQWFKEVEHIMTTPKRDGKNNDGKSARELFTENHKDLRKEGEEWMKQNATSCSVVAALIVTIMFAASFTVPGGNDQNTGYPVFRDHKWFKLFIISDAISLFSSTTSLLIFLGILTSRYDEEDFLKSLPTQLIIGLSMMFISIATMMITFSTTISIMLPENLWIVIPVILFACFPVSLFVWLQFPLLTVIYRSTYGRGIFERNMKRWF